jgi:pseudouridine synthase
MIPIYINSSLPRPRQLSGQAFNALNACKRQTQPIIHTRVTCDQSRRPPRPRKHSTTDQQKQRLNKALASAGIASRRGADDLIFAGQVQVNGVTVDHPGMQVDLSSDKVIVNGKPISASAIPRRFYFALNKPKGYICSNVSGDGYQGEGRLVVDLFNEWLQKHKQKNPKSMRPRLFTVGRLDSQSIGLVFVTNDGDWAQQVSHPSSGLTKEYSVTLSLRPTPPQIQALTNGCDIDGVHVTPVAVGIDDSDPSKPNRIRIIVAEGRNREVRKLCEAAGLGDVRVLRRVRVGGYRIPRDLGFGEVREMKPHEVRRVLNVGADRSL